MLGFDQPPPTYKVAHWAEPFRLLHWAKGPEGEPFPQEAMDIGGDVRQIVKPSAHALDTHHPLVIRPEYEEVQNKLVQNLETKDTRGLCIFGNPGAGKSVCLRYLLITMLRRGQAVLWVSKSTSFMVLFTSTFSSVVPLDYLGGRGSAHPPLVILYDALAGPIDATLWNSDDTPNYVVLATSPQIGRFWPWTKTFITSITMDTFSREEFEWLVLADPTTWEKPENCHDVLTMYDYLGPSLHTLRRVTVPKGDGTTVEQDFDLHCRNLRQMIVSTNTDLWVVKSSSSSEFGTLLPGEEPHLYHSLFRVKSIDKPGTITRFFWQPSFSIHLATPYMASLFFNAIRFRTFQEHMQYANRFSTISGVRAILFEISSIRFLSWSDSPPPIKIAGSETSLLLPGRLPTAYHALELVESSPPTSKVLHVAPVGSATLDALYEAESGIKYLFQMTIAKKHGISATGLSQVMSCYSTAARPASLDDFVLVFVVPDVQTGDKYMTKYAEGHSVKVGNELQTLRVGVLVIDTSSIVTLEECMYEYFKVAPITVDENGHEMNGRLEHLIELPPSVPSAAQGTTAGTTVGSAHLAMAPSHVPSTPLVPAAFYPLPSSAPSAAQATTGSSPQPARPAFHPSSPLERAGHYPLPSSQQSTSDGVTVPPIWSAASAPHTPAARRAPPIFPATANAGASAPKRPISGSASAEQHRRVSSRTGVASSPNSLAPASPRRLRPRPSK